MSHVISCDQVRQRIEGSKEEHQSLTTALSLYTPTNPASSGVININDIGKLSAELHVPHLAEHDAISARATVGPAPGCVVCVQMGVALFGVQ